MLVDLNQDALFPIPGRLAALWLLGGVAEFTLYGVIVRSVDPPVTRAGSGAGRRGCVARPGASIIAPGWDPGGRPESADPGWAAGERPGARGDLMHYPLLYDTSPDYLTRRGEFRAAHLALAWQAHARADGPSRASGDRSCRRRASAVRWEGDALLTWAPRLLPVGLLVVGACADSNPPAGTPQAWSSVKTGVDARAVVETVVLCKTTEAELRRALGDPSREGIFHRGRVLTWITRSDSPGQYLGVLVNRDGVVVDLYWDIPTEVPWIPTNQCAPARAPGAGSAAGERP